MRRVLSFLKQNSETVLHSAGGVLIVVTLLVFSVPTLMLQLVDPFVNVVAYAFPHFIELVLKSLLFLWMPIVLYALVHLLTASMFKRTYALICLNCGYILYLRFVVLGDFTMGDLPDFIFHLTQIYVLVLFTLNEAVWSFVGGVFLFFQGLLVTIMPDLPGNLDDFGMVFAIFCYIFIYLHSLIKGVKFVVKKLETRFQTGKRGNSKLKFYDRH